MNQAFTCPSCGAPIQYEGSGTTVRCTFCSQTIIVPDALRSADVTADLRAAPSRLSRLFDTLIPEQSVAMAEVMQALGRGDKIRAIAIYRKAFGVDLATAKAAVEAIQAGQPVMLTTGTATVSPTVTAQPSAGSRAVGCLFSLLFLAAAVVAGGLALGWLTRSSWMGPTGQLPTVVVSSDGVLSVPTVPVATVAAEGPLRIVQRVGSSGIGAGQFDDARSIALDQEGNLYVVEYGGGRVQLFRPDGTFDGQWQVSDEFPVRAMTANRQGEILIVQQGTITRYNGLSGDALGTLGSADTRYDQVAATLDGGIVAFSSSGREEQIERFNAAGEQVLVIQNPISNQTGQSVTNVALAVDGNDTIYIASARDAAIFIFSADGRFLNRIGSGGMEAGQFTALSGIAVDGQGRLYATDFHGVQQFAPDGRYLGVVDPETPVDNLFVTDDNTIWVAGRSQIYRIAVNGGR